MDKNSYLFDRYNLLFQHVDMTLKPEYDTPELKQRLTDLQYGVIAKADTERPFTGALLENHEQGTYNCMVCNTPLFKSNEKYESGSGWPSFTDAIVENIDTHKDMSLAVERTELTCRVCGAHLGHLFNDGPKDKTGLRYCINSASLNFNGEK